MMSGSFSLPFSCPFRIVIFWFVVKWSEIAFEDVGRTRIAGPQDLLGSGFFRMSTRPEVIRGILEGFLGILGGFLRILWDSLGFLFQ